MDSNNKHILKSFFFCYNCDKKRSNYLFRLVYTFVNIALFMPMKNCIVICILTGNNTLTNTEHIFWKTYFTHFCIVNNEWSQIILRWEKKKTMKKIKVKATYVERAKEMYVKRFHKGAVRIVTICACTINDEETMFLLARMDRRTDKALPSIAKCKRKVNSCK